MKIVILISALMFFGKCLAQQPEPPKLFFREDWNELPPYDVMTSYSLTQADVMNQDLIQRLYGPGQDSIKKRHHGATTDAYYVFTGFCPANWALALANKNYYADLTGNAIVRCRMMNSGFRQLRLIVKLADGKWLVGNLSEGPSSVWLIRDFVIKDIRWLQLNINTIVEAKEVEAPDLSRVDEIGFTDLMRGGLSAACSRVDWIEVYAKPVKR